MTSHSLTHVALFTAFVFLAATEADAENCLRRNRIRRRCSSCCGVVNPAATRSAETGVLVGVVERTTLKATRSAAKGVPVGVVERTKRFEGSISYMYLDTKGNVTVGVGHLLPSADSAAQLPFVFKGSGISIPEEARKSEWTTISALGFPHAASWYDSYTTMELTSSDIDQLLSDDLERFQSELTNEFGDDYSSFPDSAKAGLLDMVFNLGLPKLKSSFPKFVAAVRTKTWKVCAAECHRTGIPESRNTEVEQLFSAAAK